MMLGSSCSPCCSRDCAACGDLLLPVFFIAYQGLIVRTPEQLRTPVGPNFPSTTISGTRTQGSPNVKADISDYYSLAYENCVYRSEYSATIIYDQTDPSNISNNRGYQELLMRTGIDVSGGTVRIFWEYAATAYFSGNYPCPVPWFAANCSAEWSIPFCNFDSPARYQAGSGQNPVFNDRYLLPTPVVQSSSETFNDYIFTSPNICTYRQRPSTVVTNVLRCSTDRPQIYFLESWNPSCGPSPCNPLP